MPIIYGESVSCCAELRENCVKCKSIGRKSQHITATRGKIILDAARITDSEHYGQSQKYNIWKFFHHYIKRGSIPLIVKGVLNAFTQQGGSFR